MSRVVKFLKDENDREIEFYNFECQNCKKEVFFLKTEVDSVESKFPLAKENNESKMFCVMCSLEETNKHFKKKISKENFEIVKNIFESDKQ